MFHVQAEYLHASSDAFSYPDLAFTRRHGTSRIPCIDHPRAVSNPLGIGRPRVYPAAAMCRNFLILRAQINQ